MDTRIVFMGAKALEVCYLGLIFIGLNLCLECIE